MLHGNDMDDGKASYFLGLKPGSGSTKSGV